MNYFYPKYSQFQGPSVDQTQSGPIEKSTVSTATTTATDSFTDPLATTATNLPKQPSSSLSKPIISFNKKMPVNKTATTTKISSLPVQSQHNNINNNINNNQVQATPGLVLPSLHCTQSNSARSSVTNTPIIESLRGYSASSLMNQNSNGNILRNKLTDYADILSKLNSDTGHSCAGSGRLTPLTSKLTLDFDNNLSMSSPRSRPSLVCKLIKLK